MKTVKRTPKPESLRRKEKAWTEALIKKIKECLKSGTKVPDRFFNKYKQPDILKALQEMYGHETSYHCCYCESRINDVSYEQIEHRKPKKLSPSKYPKETFKWRNLHLSCAKCNGAKGNKFDETNEILDAAIDNIEEHLGFKQDFTNGVYRETLTDRGITTVEHANLNRLPLKKRRAEIWIATKEAIDRIKEKKAQNDARAHTAIEILKDKFTQQDGALVKYLCKINGIV